MEQQVLTKGMAGHLGGCGEKARKVRPYDMVAFFFLVVALGVFLYAGSFTREYRVSVTRVHEAYPYQMYTSMKARGKVVVGREVSLFPRMPGEVAQIYVKKGDLVKKGQLVATLEGTETMLAREQSEANLKLANAGLEQAGIELSDAESAFARDRELSAAGSFTESDRSSSEIRLRKARSALKVARATVGAQQAMLRQVEFLLGHTRIRAPFDGIVLSLSACPGDLVRPLASGAGEGSGILALADLGSMEVEVEVPGSGMKDISPGQPCEIILNLRDRPFRGEVSAVLPPAGGDAGKAVVRVGLLDHDPRIRPGSTAQVAFLVREMTPEDSKPLMTVDRSALTPFRGGYSVFMVSADRVAQKAVRLGRQFREQVEVLQGVAPGDTLVADPPDGMKHGSRVAVRGD